MKPLATLSLAGLLVLAACQVPVSRPSLPASGSARLDVSVHSGGFQYLTASGRSRQATTVVPTPGDLYLTLHDPTATHADITGLDGTLGDIPLGPWEITAEIRDTSTSNVIGLTNAATPVTLVSGVNNVSLTVSPTQTGTGEIAVDYSYDPGVIVSGGSFTLYRLTLSGTAPNYTYSETVVSGGTTQNVTASTAHFAAVGVNSGSYKLVLNLVYGGLTHPPVTATAEVYDNVTTAGTFVLTEGQMNTVPKEVPTGSISVVGTYPRLTWTSVPTTATQYTLFRNGAYLTTVPTGQTYFDDPAYPAFIDSYYEIQGINAFGMGPRQTLLGMFKSVQSINIPPTYSLLRPGDNVPLQAYTTIVPADASVQGLTNWTSTNPVVASMDPNGNLRALGVGQTVFQTAAVEGRGQSASLNSTVQAWVDNYGGVPGVPGHADGANSGALTTLPTGIVRMPDGTIYFGEGLLLRAIDPDGNVTTPTLVGSFPANIGAMTTDGVFLYAICGNTIQKVSIGAWVITPLAGTGSPGYYDSGVGLLAEFASPEGLANVGGVLYVADTQNHVIRMVDCTTGATVTYAGTAATPGANDGSVGSSTFYWPTGIVYDGQSTLYVANLGTYTIRNIQLGVNTVGTTAGTGAFGVSDGPGSAATFSSIQSLALSGNTLYASDNGYQIRRIELPKPESPFDSTVTTLAGSWSQLGTADGYGLDEARFGGDLQLAAGSGMVYATDRASHTVRQIETSYYHKIAFTDIGFINPGVMQYSYSGTWMPTGDGATGAVRVGSILLFRSGSDDRSKVLITGIDRDFNGGGRWRLHLDYVTWSSGGTIISQGVNRVYDGDISSEYFHPLSGVVNGAQSTDGWMFHGGTAQLEPGPGWTAGIYQ